MKHPLKPRALPLLPPLLWSLLAAACAPNPPGPGPGQPPGAEAPAAPRSPAELRGETFIQEKRIPRYPPGEAGGPACRITLEFRDVPAEGGLGQLIRDRLCGGAPDLRSYGAGVIEDMEARYVEAGETAAAYPDMPENALNWVYTETVTGHPRGFAPGFGEFLVVSRSRDYYLGGAHGMTEKRYLVIDPARTEALTLDRIIPPQRREALGERIEAALRRRSVEGGIVPETTDPAGPLTRWGYFEDTLEIPDNFFLTPEGIGFHWDPYEIAPYYRGPLEIIIPYEEIAGDARLPIPRSGQ